MGRRGLATSSFLPCLPPSSSPFIFLLSSGASPSFLSLSLSRFGYWFLLWLVFIIPLFWPLQTCFCSFSFISSSGSSRLHQKKDTTGSNYSVRGCRITLHLLTMQLPPASTGSGGRRRERGRGVHSNISVEARLRVSCVEGVTLPEQVVGRLGGGGVGGG